MADFLPCTMATTVADLFQRTLIIMSKTQVINIIEAVLKSGDKSPGLFDLPKIMGIKTKIESCSSVGDVLEIVSEHRSFIIKVFGLREEVMDQAMEKLKALHLQ
jgi:hypothetical protein